MPDVEDLMDILEADLNTLPPSAKENNGSSFKAPGDFSSEELTEDDWQEDALPGKLDKIRAAFLNGKTASQVKEQAALMPMDEWLGLVAKLAPKQVQIAGSFSFKHMLEEFGPINTDKYRLQGPEVVDAEVVDT